MYHQYFTTAIEKFIHVYILLVVVASLNSDITNAESEQSRVVNGRKIDITAAPYMVQIVSKSGLFMCSGAIIGQQHVLTPAHCAISDYYMLEDMRVIANSTSLRSEGKMLTIEGAFVHPEYNTNTNYKDVAVLKMKEPFVFGKGLQQVSGFCSTPMKEGSEIEISGWGCEEDGVISNDLKSIRTNLLAHESCAPKIGSELGSGMFCAHVAYGGKNICNRIIGGPVMYNNKICGIASWKYKCGTDIPTVFTDITKESDFINRALKGDTELPYIY